MSGSHVAVAHAVADVQDVDSMALGRCGVRSAQHIRRHAGIKPGCDRSLFDEVIRTEPRDPLTGSGRLSSRKQRPGVSRRTLQCGDGRAGVDVEGDRLRASVPEQLGGRRRTADLFVIEGEALTEPKALEQQQSDEQRGAAIGGCGQQASNLYVGE
jgi:hypothetical protein